MLVDHRVVLFWFFIGWLKFLLHSMYHKNAFTTLSDYFKDSLRVLLALQNYMTPPNLSMWWNLIFCVTDVIDQHSNIFRLRIFIHPLAYLICSLSFCGSPKRKFFSLFYQLMNIK